MKNSTTGPGNLAGCGVRKFLWQKTRYGSFELVFAKSSIIRRGNARLKYLKGVGGDRPTEVLRPILPDEEFPLDRRGGADRRRTLSCGSLGEPCPWEV